MERFALLTSDYKIVKSDSRGCLHTVALSSLSSLDNVLYVTKRVDDYTLQVISPALLWWDVEKKRVNRAFANGYVTIENISGFFSVKTDDGKYLQARECGMVAYNSFSEGVLERNCLFRFLSEQELDFLWYLTRNEWVIDPCLLRARVNEADSSSEFLSFGSFTLSLETILENFGRFHNKNEFIFLSDDNIYRVVLYRPVLFYAAFGETVINQLVTSLESLVDPGFYTGDIIIITNIDHASFKSVCPRQLYPKCHIVRMEAFDYADFVAIRQTVLASGLLDKYSPIIYIDTDVVVNCSLNKIMTEGAPERFLSAQFEYWHDDFRYTESSGQLLYGLDPFPVDRKCGGFNGGVLLIPQILKNKPYLDLAFYSHIVYSTRHGRSAIPFREQHVMNYALQKLQAVDLTFITARTDVGGNLDSDIVQHYGSMDVRKPRGFIHFWCTAVAERAWPMSDYIRKIRDYRKRDH
ncbi:hypothetical protein PT277_06890 [Acetobacteraceae bacterium ESL0709]|nr:hypothetical protein [Acetobacteraceae bacterium ESL0697]MDF7678418.1 hypothetical protein [Acetobacteraceae bacterium ESL0709]